MATVATCVKRLKQSPAPATPVIVLPHEHLVVRSSHAGSSREVPSGAAQARGAQCTVRAEMSACDIHIPLLRHCRSTTDLRANQRFSCFPMCFCLFTSYHSFSKTTLTLQAFDRPSFDQKKRAAFEQIRFCNCPSSCLLFFARSYCSVDF